MADGTECKAERERERRESPIALFVDAAVPAGTQFVIARYDEPTEWLR